MNPSMKSALQALLATALAGLIALAAAPAQAERIKDIASIAGIRSNQLLGYGFVVGLDGTGDQTSQAKFTLQSLRNMLLQLGINITSDSDPQLKNVAAVMVTADLPPFSKPGQEIDVTVSSLANAKSLRGGTLLMTPLKGVDGQVYAVAQGNLVVGGFGGEGSDGSRITVNVPSVGRIPNGATVERMVPTAFAERDALILNLYTADFTTATRVAETINATLGNGTAKPLDASSIRVSAPLDASQRVPYMSLVENLVVEPGTAPARIVVNSRTGTVVIGSEVRVMPAAVAHGSLTVTISETTEVSQPQPFGQGTTETVVQSDVEITQEGERMFLFQPGVSLDEIVRAVNEVGAAPGDLMAILEALKQAGALRAELIVI
jgi:flagellar P-ring protein precursor FlgI